jgi:hypothetical protein
LVELGKFVSDYGFFAFIIVAFGALGIYLSVRFFLKLHSDISEVTEITKELGGKIITTKGDPQIHYDLIKSLENNLQTLNKNIETYNHVVNKHYDAMERLTSGETFLHCNVDKCPYMGKIVSSLGEVSKRFDEFNVRAKESRTVTGSSLKDIQSQMATLASEVSAQSKQVVQLLGDVLTGRKK